MRVNETRNKGVRSDDACVLIESGLLPMGDAFCESADDVGVLGGKDEVFRFSGIVMKVEELVFVVFAEGEFPAIGRDDGSGVRRHG